MKAWQSITQLARFVNLVTSLSSSLDAIGTAVANGQGVIAEVDSHVLWQNLPGYIPPPKFAPHAVVVTGVEYDDAGNVTDVIINDTGTGQCSRKVPVDIWNEAIQSYEENAHGYVPKIIVTQNPIF